MSDPSGSTAEPPILQVSGLNAGYQGSRVLFDIAFTIPAGRSLAIVGRNGAGKTTLVRALLAHHPLDSGVVSWRGRDLARTSASVRARLGIGYVPQDQVVFPRLTVRENLVLGLSAVPRKQRAGVDFAFDLFPKLAARADQAAGTMSGGERKMVGIGRALLGQPRLLVMDEPTEGVWHGVVAEITERLNALTDLSLLVVEQHLQFAMDLADDVIVLERGCVAERKTRHDLLTAPHILDRYLAM